MCRHRDKKEYGTFKELNKDHAVLECIMVGRKTVRDGERKKILINYKCTNGLINFLI